MLSGPTRVVLLPRSAEDKQLQLFTLPHPRTGEACQYYLDNDTLFELRKVDGQNPHQRRGSPESKGMSVKSLVFEQTTPTNAPLGDLGGPTPSDSPNKGFVMEDPLMMVATKYNLAYTFIAHLAKGDSTRYQTVDDHVESLAGMGVIPLLPALLVHRSLAAVCETITEDTGNGEETFYRFSRQRCLDHLHQRVILVASRFPHSVMEAHLKPMLHGTSTPSEEVVTQCKQKYAAMIVGSYLGVAMAAEVAKGIDTTQLDAFLVALQEQRGKAAMVEENMRLLAEKSAGVKKLPKVVKKVAKKVVTKVKVGAGGLDRFFKKA